MHDDLKQNIARMEKELAEMKESLARRERNWPDKITKGMVFRHENRGEFMTHSTASNSDDWDLVDLTFCPGNAWSHGKKFNGQEGRFTYLGLAKDVLSVNAK